MKYNDEIEFQLAITRKGGGTDEVGFAFEIVDPKKQDYRFVYSVMADEINYVRNKVAKNGVEDAVLLFRDEYVDVLESLTINFAICFD